MDKTIDISDLRRSDVGGVHKKYRHGGCKIGMYNYAGELECEYNGIEEAVRDNPVGGTYSGIVNCISGRIKRHAGKIWRKEEI